MSGDTFHHVYDAKGFDLPFGQDSANHIYDIPLPEIFGFQITKFMVLQVVAFVFCVLVFKGLAKRMSSGEPVKGRWWNFWETLVLFVRDDIVRPTIGEGHHDHDHDHGDDHAHYEGIRPEAHGEEVYVDTHAGGSTVSVVHPADQYLPFVLSCFFYVLICNLLGAIPWLGSATGNLNLTGALAITVLGAVIMYGSRASGPVGFWATLCPSIDLPGKMAVLKIILVPMIWVIELVGLFIKHGVLAVRLFANIMAGHTVIAVILGFIALAADSASPALWYIVTPASVIGQVLIGLLELFVAFLQAYVFSFLTTLFISAAVHPH